MGVASEIPNMVDWLLRDFSFLARHRVCRVLKLCVLVTGRPRAVYPAVNFDLSGSKLSIAKFQECLHLVQSYMLSPGYEHQSFFTEPTMEAVQDAISNAGVFYVAPNFDLWADFCGGVCQISSPNIVVCMMPFCWHSGNHMRFSMWRRIKRTGLLVLNRCQQVLLLSALMLRVLGRTRWGVSGLRQGQQRAAIKRLQVVLWCQKPRKNRRKMMILMFGIG